MTEPILTVEIYPSMFGEISQELWESLTEEEQRALLERYEDRGNNEA